MIDRFTSHAKGKVVYRCANLLTCILIHRGILFIFFFQFIKLNLKNYFTHQTYVALVIEIINIYILNKNNQSNYKKKIINKCKNVDFFINSNLY